MAIFQNIFDIDLRKPTAPTPLTQIVCQAGNASNRIGCRVYEDGSPVSLGGTCTAYIQRADGFVVTKSGTISGNLAYVELDSNCTAVPGLLIISVNWASGNKRTTLLNAFGTVEKTTDGTIIDPSGTIPSVESYTALVTRAETAAGVISGLSTSSQLIAGDRYRCVVTKST